MAESIDTAASPAETADTGTNGAHDSAEADVARCVRYADIAVELGYCSRERADAALRKFAETGAEPQEFGAYLVVEEALITREQGRAVERALRGRSTIGGFAILEKVGQGGMGTVFRARQISMDRIVAVKILAPKYAQDPSFKQRFLNEARTCAKLSHLNIINGIDCGEDSGYTYFAMEFVEGNTVKQLLAEKERLEPDAAFKIVRQMADALSYARKFEMVHRDIKPDNIMLTPAGVAKLCDLGLAMQTEPAEAIEAVAPVVSEDVDAATDENAETGENESVPAAEGAAAQPAEKPKGKCLALGTPHYMSPEQARGERNIDARSDIYSLGATLYHLLTGQTMFEGKNSTEVMTRQVVGEAPNPCVIDPEIPAGLGMIISKMTAKLPADRYANADELIADLDAVKNGAMPVAAAFNARSSCAILPAEQLQRLQSGGSPRWLRMLPHMAAAVVLGALAYYAAITFGSKGGDPISTGTTTPTIESQTHTVPTTQVPPTTVQTPTPATNTTKSTTPEVVKPVDSKEVIKPPVKPDVPDHKTDVVPDKIPDKVKTPPVQPDKQPDVVIPPPIPEIPRPELKLTPDIFFARFLQEYENLQDAETRTGKFELNKFLAALTKIAAAPEYAPAKKDIDAELADLKSAIEFEKKSGRKIADTKADVVLPPDKAKLFNAANGKAIGYDDGRGLNVSVQGAEFPIALSVLPADFIVANSPERAPLARAQYLFARGNKPALSAILPLLSPEELKRWERKLQLLTDREAELTAREAYKNLVIVAEAKSWKTLSEMIIDFNTNYGSTPTARTNSAQIRQWQEAALRALEPPSRWRAVFHAATVRDIPNSKGDPTYVELVYDFKTPEQAHDFAIPETHGQLHVENGHLIVPSGGGDFANVRFIAPFSSIQSFQADGRSLHPELRPMGIVFVTVKQFMTGPNPGSPLLKLDPDSKTASLENMFEFHAPPGAAPTFNWAKDISVGFKTSKGEKTWTIDGKPIGEARLPSDTSGGWIALWGAQGNQSWDSIRIVLQPDKDWIKPKKKGEPPPPKARE